MKFSFNILNKKLNSGSALLFTVLSLVAVSLLVISGISFLSLSEVRTTKEMTDSKKTFLISDSAVRDAVYRIQSGKETSASESFDIDGVSVDMSITDVDSSNKEISSIANIGDLHRRARVDMSKGEGVAFNYGVQVGTGGFQMDNNAGVVGNVYSNGHILGSSGVFVTGSAFAANFPSDDPDQYNQSPIPPPEEIPFADVSERQSTAQSFIADGSEPVHEVELFLKRLGGPSNVTVRLVEDDGGQPSDLVLASADLSASLVSGDFNWIRVPFSSNPNLTTGERYWLVLEASTGDSNNHYVWGANNNGYTSGDALIGRFSDGDWQSTSPTDLDGYFRLFLEGEISRIENVNIGQDGIGDAHANTVLNSNIQGDLYCQDGSGNNQPCDTSLNDPSPQFFPVSSANIDVWKSDAQDGGVISGDYTPSGSSSYLGPTKIAGDLTLPRNHNLVIEGTIWVEGNIEVENNVSVSLDSDFNEESGVIVSDGYVDLGNNVNFDGSGQEGSYVMLLTTSDCPDSAYCNGQDAITLSNNADAVILNAQNGSLYLRENTGAKEATAAKILMSNNSTIEYESGLESVNFVSGPGGAWRVTDWRE